MDELRKLAQNKKNSIELDNSLNNNQQKYELEKINTLLYILKSDDCFLKIEYNLAFEILKYLGIKEEDIDNYYINIIKNSKSDNEFDIIDITKSDLSK